MFLGTEKYESESESEDINAGDSSLTGLGVGDGSLVGLRIGEGALAGLCGCMAGLSSGGGLEETAGAAATFLRLGGASVGVFPRGDGKGTKDWSSEPSQEVQAAR